MNAQSNQVYGLKNWIVLLLLFSILGCGAPSDSDVDTAFELSTPKKEPDSRRIEDMFRTLAVLEEREMRVSFGQKVYDLKKRVEIADELNTFELDSEERKRTVLSLIDALAKLHATREVKSSERLRSLSHQLKSDPDLDIARSARIAYTGVRLVDFIRTEFGKFPPLREAIIELLENYPKDIQIAQNLDTIVAQLVRRGKDDQAVEVMELMLDTYGKQDDSNVKTYAASLSDRKKLVNLGYKSILSELRQGGANERKALLDCMKTLAKDPSIGIVAYEEILRAGRWLESNERYSNASSLYFWINDIADNHSNEYLAKRAKEDAKSGFQRLRLVNQTLLIEGNTITGDELNPEDFADKVVLLFFWSAENPISVQAMGQLFPAYQAFPRNKFEIIAICTDDDPQKTIQVLGTRVPPWNISLPNSESDSQTKNLVEVCGINSVPYAILLDPTGKVTKINLPISDLDNQIRKQIRLQNTKPQ